LAFAFRPSSTRRRKRNGPSVRGTLRPDRKACVRATDTDFHNSQIHKPFPL
jgi:hypothetical protein